MIYNVFVYVSDTQNIILDFFKDYVFHKLL